MNDFSPQKVVGMKNYPYFCGELLNENIMEQNVKPARNGMATAAGPMIITDEETRRFFTDSNGCHHTVVFLDKDSGERRFGRW